MPLSDQQRADIEQQFARGDRRTKTVVPLFCAAALLLALVGVATGATWLITIGLAATLTIVVLTVFGVGAKAWMRRRL